MTGSPLHRLLPFLVAALVSLVFAPETLADTLQPPPSLAQEGNACLPTSAAMALHSLGEPTRPQEIARRLPFHPDGTDFFDLQEELTRRGFASLVLTEEPAAIVSAIRAGYPVVAAVHAGGTKHAVLVWGLSSEGPEPLLRYTDPRGGVEKRESLSTFKERQYAQQLMVIWPAGDPADERLRAAAFPLDAARATNARFRAQALLLRADRHSEPNSQVLELLRQAVDADPGWEETQTRLAEVESAHFLCSEWSVCPAKGL